MSINGHKQKKREWLRYRDFVLSPYGVIKIKSLGYMMVTRFPLCAASCRRSEIVHFAFIRVSLAWILLLRIVLNRGVQYVFLCCAYRWFSDDPYPV
ncbi:hypothetical protein [Symbiopectobacterium sp. RP]|uniref:hypothetical protein n=1 Tax=Symbiopectobacterium sp. RP TaxID=3248553 RepID=UPI003D2DE663